MSAQDLVLVLAMTVAVYAPKAAPLVLVSDRAIARLEKWLRFVAPAVLGALVAPSILVADGQLVQIDWHHAAFVVAAAVAILTRRMVTSVALGLATLLLSRLALP